MLTSDQRKRLAEVNETLGHYLHGNYPGLIVDVLDVAQALERTLEILSEEPEEK